MLKGHFENCYGLENFDLIPIPFTPEKTKAVIYAPNGVMKSSLAKVFDNLSRKKKTEDRIYAEKPATFSINYYDQTYTEKQKKAESKIYVISSFDAAFESYSDSVATILADDELKNEYSEVMQSFSEKLQPLIDALQRHCSPGISVQELVSESYYGNTNKDWDSIIKAIAAFLDFEKPSELLAAVRFDEIFNPQVMKVIGVPNFAEKIREYVSVIESLLQESKLLNSQFDDHNAREFGESIAKTRLFDAHHRILLSDGTIISNLDEWESVIKVEMTRINDDPEVKALYTQIDKGMNANTATKKLREIIKSNHMLLAYFDDLDSLRKRFWASYAVAEGINIDALASAVQSRDEDIFRLNERAATQLTLWRRVISNFRTRFRAPFDVSIDNESRVVLRGEPARLTFSYERHGEPREKSKEELMNCLSVGEKRALYLLQILFDLEKIQASARLTGKKHLVIADDIADSFDYTNKYAIIEYLDELSSNQLVDLLILTHNFDFYRTVSSRLGIGYDMCFVAQKETQGAIKMDQFAYRNDYFTKGILEQIRNGQIWDSIEKQKLIIASIPFCRNIAQYLGEVELENTLTSLLHIKPNTASISLLDYWNKIRTVFKMNELHCPALEKAPVVDIIFDFANKLVIENSAAVSLENKVVMSIAIRLRCEMYLRQVLVDNNEELQCSEHQTRVWIKRARRYIDPKHYDVLNTVGLITPESIHVNAFMYEPLIDIPNWQLFDLYSSVEDVLFGGNSKGEPAKLKTIS